MPGLRKLALGAAWLTLAGLAFGSGALAHLSPDAGRVAGGEPGVNTSAGDRGR